MAFEFETVRDILACPQCHGDLVCSGNALVCASAEHRLSFLIVDEIPRLLLEESTELSAEEWSQVMEQQKRDPKTGKALPQSP